MSTSKEIVDLINHKFAKGEVNIEFEQLISELYGEPNQYIEEFRNNFGGKFNQETKELLMKAGIEALMTEDSLLFYEVNELRDNFGSLVQDMLFGSGDLKKKAVDKRSEIAEKQFCIRMAIEELKLIRKDMNEFLKPAQKVGPGFINKSEHERLTRKKLWWMD
jgi:hypothetical protein